MKVLIVHAHPEPKSVNGDLTRHAVDVLTSVDHEVVVSDLYRMGFDPVSDRRNFTAAKDPDYYNQQVEELHATRTGGFAPDLAAEQAKLDDCDILIFQFPLWWFGPPAILKGWVDRVLALGKAYEPGQWFDRGRFSGKRAMLSVTTSAPESTYATCGPNGEIREILYPLHYGVLYFTGFEVLPPFVAYAAAHAPAESRPAFLAAYRRRLLRLETTEPILFPSLNDYDESFGLDAPSGT